MLPHAANQPIGIFDSGLGGLTVARAITEALPHENLVYFGDTAHVPWGDKSKTAIQAYALRICDFLLKQGCKLIVIACHTGSSSAYDLLRHYVRGRALLVDVIEPLMVHLQKNYAYRTLGLIGTRQTVYSNVYKKKIDDLNVSIQLKSLATPLLVPLIEEGFVFKKDITSQILNIYLADEKLQGIDSLILGCTHYPVLKPFIEEFFEEKVSIIDASAMIAGVVRRQLEENLLIADTPLNQVSKRFYVSDLTASSESLAQFFFNQELSLEYYSLWDL